MMNEQIKKCPVCGANKLELTNDSNILCPLCDTIFTNYIPQKEIETPKDIYKKSIDSILEIYSYIDEEEICGTGIVINSNGDILTSAHIVEKIQKQDKIVNFNKVIIVQKNHEESIIDSNIQILDKDLDLAIIRSNNNPNSSYLNISQDTISEGEKVYVIGNTNGEGLCMVDGIVSDSVRIINNRQLIMISAPVTFGCSGAPVLNSHGDVIGIVTGGNEKGSFMNYAIPNTVIQSFINKI